MSASPARRAILDAAKRERRALNAWVRDGRRGARPLTPALTALAAERPTAPRGHNDEGRRGD